MKVKTSELSGAALDWVAAQCEGVLYQGPAWTKYSSDWAQGGAIIDRERINLRMHPGVDKQCAAFVWVNHAPAHREFGDTPLIAAMRCFVASQLGDEVEVPDELLEGLK